MEGMTVNKELRGLLDFHGVAHRGDVLVIEMQRRLTVDDFCKAQEMVRAACAPYGIGVILLDESMRVAGRKTPHADLPWWKRVLNFSL